MRERSLLERRPTLHPQAYEHYLRAKQLNHGLMHLVPMEHWEQVVRLLEQAVSADPEFAQAHVLLVRTHVRMYWFGTVDPSATRYELARSALAILERVAPSAPETAFARASFASFCDLKWAEGLRHHEAALLELPNDSELLRSAGWVQLELGRYADATATMTRGYELNPLDMQCVVNLVVAQAMRRQFSAVVAVLERAMALSPQTAAFVQRAVEIARFELHGSREELVRRLRSLPVGSDLNGVVAKYETAMKAGDWVEASQQLADRRLKALNFEGVLDEPVSLHRALVARLLEQRAAAASHAAEAGAILRARSPVLRMRPYTTLALARAMAYGGEEREALRLANALQRDLTGIGNVDRTRILNELGRLYAFVGARDEALACLRTLMTGLCSPYGSPHLARIDPCWSRLADDPRFEEILKAAKPL